MVILNRSLESTAVSGRGETGSVESVARRRWAQARRCGLAFLAHLLLGTLLLRANVWAAEFDEYAVKAAYLYNFAKFVEWPQEAFATADAPLRICIVGDNPFGDALAALSGKTAQDHPVETRLVSAATGFGSCHIVFISGTEQGQFKTLLAKLSRLPILTVSDINAFAQAGGMIGLVEADQRIRFDINLAAARQVGLKISSQLLKLATIVN